jgi:hypothetical protein
MIKAIIPDILLAEWFTKSLLPLIARDVAMGDMVTEEQAIAWAQYLDLVYSQFGTLYDLLTNATRANTDPSKPSSSSHADGVIGSVKTQYFSQSTTLSSTSPQTQISKVNVVQSVPSQQSRGKKKKKNKSKNNNEQPKNQTPATEKKTQWKVKFPCIICCDNNYTRDCPLHNEVAKIFQGKLQSIVLTPPFPQQQSMVVETPSPGGSSIHPNDEASSSAHIYMFNGINLTARSKAYNTPGNPDKGKYINGTSTLLDPSPSCVSLPSGNPPSGPIKIEKPTFESILHPPNNTICKATFNPSSRAAQNYNIVEDLVQESCAMSALEFYRIVPVNVKFSWPLLALLILIRPTISCLTSIIIHLDSPTNLLSKLMLLFTINKSTELLWMREPQIVSCL